MRCEYRQETTSCIEIPVVLRRTVRFYQSTRSNDYATSPRQSEPGSSTKVKWTGTQTRSRQQHDASGPTAKETNERTTSPNLVSRSVKARHASRREQERLKPPGSHTCNNRGGVLEPRLRTRDSIRDSAYGTGDVTRILVARRARFEQLKLFGYLAFRKPSSDGVFSRENKQILN